MGENISNLSANNTENNKNHYDYRFILWSFILSAGLFYFIRFFEHNTYQVFLMDHYLGFHTLVEYASIVMYIASFLVIYYTGDRENSLRMIITATALFFVAFIDFWHTFSYEGMPGLIVGSSIQSATSYWIIGRMGFALGILVGAFVPIDKERKLNNRYLVSLIPVLLSIVFLVVISYFPESFPKMFVEGQGLTPVKQMLEVVIILIMIIAFIKLFIEYRKDKRNTLALFLSALIISIFSELSFTNYANIYDTYNLLGHVYKLIASYMIFRVMFIYNIKHPYDELDEAEKKINNYANNLEKLVDIRTKEVEEANEELLKDIEYAKSIQNAIMPVKEAKFENLDFYSEYIPFEKVGGDYYGLEEIDDEYVAFYLGDVSGHGIPAAMMTIFMRQTIVTHRKYQNEIKEIFQPKIVIENLYNKFNETDFPTEMYTVMVYGLFNKKTMKITFSSAGLNTYPLMYQGKGKVTKIEHKGFPICKFEKNHKPKYENYEIDLDRGSKMLFYTDGTVEAMNRQDHNYGEENLVKILEKVGDKSSKEISEEIIKKLNKYVNNEELKDDVNYLILSVPNN
ncbi:MAG: MASE3 domain-containing protein [Bacillota bacterium]|nr:MASE3 domain-containing protein [Bacillota bacterium]